jgi:porphobilinogen synthase
MYLRRLRYKKGFRDLISETIISPKKFVQPVFVVNGKNQVQEIPFMPGIYRYSVDKIVSEIEKIQMSGVGAILIFGIPDKKDVEGKVAISSKNLVLNTIKVVKKNFPEMIIIADVCLCNYTTYGHCGIVKKTVNDVLLFDEKKTLSVLSEIARIYAEYGADIVAPSAMMDHQVQSIRENLDKHNLNEIAIMSYSAKYASSFYGPFRVAVYSEPRFGNRQSYQLPPENLFEALREVETDIKEGADIVMVKPALAYLDVIRAVKEKFNIPLAAFNVSGEYSLVKSASKLGWVDEENMVKEILFSIRRAGADIIISYWAKEVIKWLKN